MKFYIQNRGPVGNCAQWWRTNGNGYTCNLRDAGKYDEDYAKGLERDRPGIDKAWPVDVVDAIAETHVDIQNLRALRKP